MNHPPTPVPAREEKTPRRVPIVRFHPPHGRTSDSWCEVSDEAFAKYELAKKLGLRVTAEIILGDKVSTCLEHPELGDFDCRLGVNGPGEFSPPALLEKMLLEFTEDSFRTWETAVS